MNPTADVVGDALGVADRGWLEVRLCEGFRTPARRPYPHAPTAGVRKAPMDEIARGGATTVRRALRGFDRDADADEGGGTPSDAIRVLEPAGTAHNPSVLARVLSK